MNSSGTQMSCVYSKYDFLDFSPSAFCLIYFHILEKKFCKFTLKSEL